MADDLGLDEATVYRYVQAFTARGLEKYLAHERLGYWGLLTSAQLAALCRDVNRTHYTNAKGIRQWLAQTCQVNYLVSGLTQLLHQLGFCYKRTTPVPCQADADAQTTFFAQLASLEADEQAGWTVLYYADGVHITHNMHYTRAWCARGKERPLPTVSGREQVNLHASLNAYQPTQLLLDERIGSTCRAHAASTSNCWLLIPPTRYTSSMTTPPTTRTES